MQHWAGSSPCWGIIRDTHLPSFQEGPSQLHWVGAADFLNGWGWEGSRHMMCTEGAHPEAKSSLQSQQAHYLGSNLWKWIPPGELKNTQLSRRGRNGDSEVRSLGQREADTLTRLPYSWEEGVLLVRVPAHPGQSAPVPGDCRWSLLCLRALGSSAPLWLIWTTCLNLTQLQTAHGQRQNRVHSEARPCDTHWKKNSLYKRSSKDMSCC